MSSALLKPALRRWRKIYAMLSRRSDSDISCVIREARRFQTGCSAFRKAVGAIIKAGQAYKIPFVRDGKAESLGELSPTHLGVH